MTYLITLMHLKWMDMLYVSFCMLYVFFCSHALWRVQLEFSSCSSGDAHSSAQIQVIPVKYSQHRMGMCVYVVHALT